MVILTYSSLKDWESFQIFILYQKSPFIIHSFANSAKFIKCLLYGNCDTQLVGNSLMSLYFPSLVLMEMSFMSCHNVALTEYF